ncbi:hypothetical protein MRS76_20505 [Rhizobiaceae bacterium n13]|uniref:hypothetical protein n=1 Tax=Ferirhizobium litorale TaxID=2927786 RepID=UPI0024B2D9D7|nr:hypothetical protein [Fererhizobium litorale]MDI7864324.1 hypothetical protein [Fererhizobium litorale]
MSRPCRKVNTVTDGAPIGPRGVKLLNRVRHAGGTYPLECNRDRDSAGRAIAGGFLRRDARDDTLVHITGKGLAYLDHLARAV